MNQHLNCLNTSHDWAVFLTPSPSAGRYMANEPYYFERNNGITTWIRPFDYIEPESGLPLAVGEGWRREINGKQRQKARQRAKQDKPIKQKVIKGAPEWKIVESAQGRVYFYNTTTKISRWDRPAEIPLDEEESEKEEEEGLNETTEMNEEDAEWMLEQMMEDEDDEEQDVGETEQISKEEKMAQFKEMLQEAKLNLFGTWNSQSQQFAEDPRFMAITDDSERQELFDVVCRELAATTITTSKAKSKPDLTGIHPFDELLQEKAKKHKKTSFAKFANKYLKDPRFLSLKTSREREKRYNSYINK